MGINCNKIISVLKKEQKELSISDIVTVSKLSRSLVRTMLAGLEGAEKVPFRKIGNAKVYSLKKEKQPVYCQNEFNLKKRCKT